MTYYCLLRKEEVILILFYNAFIRINGVEDKVNYVHDLLKLGQELKSSGRSVVIVNNEIPAISESVKGDNNATNNVVCK